MNASPTLSLFDGEAILFSSHGKWLHPIFEMEAFLQKSGHDPGRLRVKDKIVGRGAALLFVHLKMGRVSAELLSLPGKSALETFGLPFDYQALTERIQCQTESLLLEETDPERAYALLRKRAGW